MGRITALHMHGPGWVQGGFTFNKHPIPPCYIPNITGTHAGATYACKSGWTLAGTDLATLTSTNAAACRESCFFSQDCRFYQHNALTSTCVLRTAPLLGSDGRTGQAAVSINTCGVDVSASAIVRNLDTSTICQAMPGLCPVPFSKVVLPGTHNSGAFSLPATFNNVLNVLRPLNNSRPVAAANQALNAMRGEHGFFCHGFAVA